MQNNLGSAATSFGDPSWIDRLDVLFANLYFAAVTTAHQRGTAAVPRAWRPLFENRFAGDVARIQFALAGMNAHINRDLVVALLALYDEAGAAPADGSVQHRDFTLVDALLERVQQRVSATLWVGTPLVFGGHLAPLETLVASWSVSHARQAAWDHSQAFWQLRWLPMIRRASLDSLDGLAQLAGHGLLVRVLP